MRGAVAAIAGALVVALAGCGADNKPASSTSPTFSDFSTGPVTIDSPELRRIYGWLQVKQAAKLLAVPAGGRRVIAAAGCLACHQIGSDGNSGPGNNLTGIGARRSRAEIRRALLGAKAPMPSYRDLPRKELDDLVAYLSALRGRSPGGEPCPDGADCG